MNKRFVLIMSAILSLTACSKNNDNSGQVELSNDSKEVSSASQAMQQNSELSEDKKIPELLKNGLPKEFYGNWESSADTCGIEGESEGVYIDSTSFTGYENPCDVKKAEKVTSNGHIRLTLKCPNDYTDDSSGFFKRFVTVIISNNKLKVSDDSQNQDAKPYELVRCPQINNTNAETVNATDITPATDFSRPVVPAGNSKLYCGTFHWTGKHAYDAIWIEDGKFNVSLDSIDTESYDKYYQPENGLNGRTDGDCICVKGTVKKVPVDQTSGGEGWLLKRIEGIYTCNDHSRIL
jgi:hypothetical protein